MTLAAFRDRTGDQWKQVFREAGPELVAERDAFIAAATRYYTALESNGAFERPPESLERYIADLLDEGAHAGVAAEVREYLAWI